MGKAVDTGNLADPPSPGAAALMEALAGSSIRRLEREREVWGVFMTERAASTESNAQHLIETLKARRQGFRTYVEGEVRHKQVPPQIGQWILMTMRRLHPDVFFDELTDLLLLFRNLARKQLSLEW